MSVFDCGQDLTKFHNDEITLSKDEQDEMRKRRNTGRRRLQRAFAAPGPENARHGRPDARRPESL